jgi:malonyl-CoA O-methyltransferase
MSSISHPSLSRSATIARAFGARVAEYESHAGLQRIVAERLATFLPPRSCPRVLELGCGTGLLSRRLIESYPDGSFLLTDLAPAMLAECRRNLGDKAGTAQFQTMDASRPVADGPFDLIAMSMILHWLPDPVAVLRQLQGLLAPGGMLLYATISGSSFPEWRDVLERLSLASGLVELPELPGVIDEEMLVAGSDTLTFLRRMKAVGGITAKEGYAQLSAGQLRRAIRLADCDHGGRITWHILYGRLGASFVSD